MVSHFGFVHRNKCLCLLLIIFLVECLVNCVKRITARNPPLCSSSSLEVGLCCLRALLSLSSFVYCLVLVNTFLFILICDLIHNNVDAFNRPHVKCDFF